MADGTLLLGVLLQEGQTPLHRAAYKGHQEAIELLVSKNADIQSQGNVRPSPPCVPWCASLCVVWLRAVTPFPPLVCPRRARRLSI